MKPITTASEIEALHEKLSNWRRWGAQDQLGTLNLITPAKRAAAAALVRSGRAVGCGRALDTTAAPDNLRPVAHQMLGTGATGSGADTVTIASHGYAISHVDALCHIFRGGRLYNGYPAERVTEGGAEELGIEAWRDGIVSRGVLLDLPRLRGARWLEPGTPILPADLEACEERCGVRALEGDVLLVRTGRWAYRAEHGAWDPHERLAGLQAACLPWLRERDVAALGSDGVSDVVPSGVEGERLPIHAVAIPTLGLPLLDNLELERLAETCAEEERWAFLFAVAPLVLAGGTASPANPIALL